MAFHGPVSMPATIYSELPTWLRILLTEPCAAHSGRCAGDRQLELERYATMRTLPATDEASALAKPLGAEDLRPGDVVAVLSEYHEYPSFLWCGDAHVLPPDELILLKWRGQDQGEPLKVKAVCLPYVLVKRPHGGHHTLDVRQCELVRLGEHYAQAAWKALRKRSKKLRD